MKRLIWSDGVRGYVCPDDSSMGNPVKTDFVVIGPPFLIPQSLLANMDDLEEFANENLGRRQIAGYVRTTDSYADVCAVQFYTVSV